MVTPMEIMETKRADTMNPTDVTDDFIHLAKGAITEDICYLAKQVFQSHQDHRLVLFFQNLAIPGDLTSFKNKMKELIVQHLGDYISKKNVDILNKNCGNKFKLYNMEMMGAEEEKTIAKRGQIHFMRSGDEYINSYIHYFICVENTAIMCILNKKYLLEQGDIIFFPSSWVFPYNCTFGEDGCVIQGKLYV